jgi:hypothetical protein
MSIVSDITALFGTLRNNVGGFTDDAERYITAALSAAKTEEDSAQAKIEAEIAHLTSLGYTVTKTP